MARIPKKETRIRQSKTTRPNLRRNIQPKRSGRPAIPATLCRAISTVLNVESLDVTPSGPSLLNKSASSFVQRVEMLATPTVVSKPKPIVVGHPIHTLAELQQQIHDDLRRQHPEWIEPNGES